MRTEPLLLILFLAAAAHAADQRAPLALESGQREVVLGEMRSLLQAVSGIVSSLAENDHVGVARAARRVGMEMVGKSEGDRRLMKALPPEFLNLGLSVHRDFDMLAAAAEGTPDRSDLLRRLGEITARCSSCHDSYRTDSPCTPAPSSPETDYHPRQILLSLLPHLK